MIQRNRAVNGVSNVIGMILLIAITIIAASILGQFVFDLTDMLEQPVQANVEIDEEYNPATDMYNTRITLTNELNVDRVQISAYPPAGYDGAIRSPILREVGDSEVTQYPEGTFIAVVAVRGEDSSVIRQYTIGK